MQAPNAFRISWRFACLTKESQSRLLASSADALNPCGRQSKRRLSKYRCAGRADIRAAWRVATLVRRRGIHILHTHGARALMVGRTAAALTGVPIVHHVHGNTSSEVSGRRFTRLNALTERLLLSKTQRVIAVSPSVAAYLRSVGVPEEKNCVDPQRRTVAHVATRRSGRAYRRPSLALSACCGRERV